MSRIITNNLRHNDATADNLTLDSSGNATVNGTLTATSFSGDGSSLTGLSSDAITEGNTSVEVVDTGSNGHITFDTEGSERMRIDSAGDILVSKTGAGNGSNTDVITLDNDNSNTNDNLKTSIAFKRTGNNSNYIYSRISSERTGTHDTDIVFATNYGGSLSEELRIKANGGITFNGDTAAANALADYEEGTWTPTTYSNNLSVGSASYVKVGKMVTVHCYLTGVSSWTAATSNPFWIFSFPFAPDGGSGYSAVGSVTLHAISTSQSGTLSAVMDSTNGRCRIQNNPTNGSFDTITLAEMGATTWTCTVSITYRTTT